MTAMRKPHSSI